jgi:hypothetical protein
MQILPETNALTSIKMTMMMMMFLESEAPPSGKRHFCQRHMPSHMCFPIKMRRMLMMIIATDGELNWAGEEECEDPRPSTQLIWQAWQTHSPWFFFFADNGARMESICGTAGY